METTITFKPIEFEKWAKEKGYTDLMETDLENFLIEKIVKHFNIKKKLSINKLINEVSKGAGFFDHVRSNYIKSIYFDTYDNNYYIKLYDKIKELS